MRVKLPKDEEMTRGSVLGFLALLFVVQAAILVVVAAYVGERPACLF